MNVNVKALTSSTAPVLQDETVQSIRIYLPFLQSVPRSGWPLAILTLSAERLYLSLSAWAGSVHFPSRELTFNKCVTFFNNTLGKYCTVSVIRAPIFMVAIALNTINLTAGCASEWLHTDTPFTINAFRYINTGGTGPYSLEVDYCGPALERQEPALRPEK